MAHTALDEISTTDTFVRTEAGHRGRTMEVGGKHPPEAGRYHLYTARACPRAAGALTVLYLKGLEGVISYSAAHPTWARTRPEDPTDVHTGWHFRAPEDAPVANGEGHGANECDDACIPDLVNGCKTVRELYEMAGDTVHRM
ncbi:hypothetical protein T492DRAFT_887410 [Pavlovales sp. CCMP2436]|nr:hypothetical protein T492DRAFT_887410 [Pavlovales sp. CCMP2436]